MSTILSKYLDQFEANDLVETLKSSNLNAFAKAYGLPKFLGGIRNYLVMVDKKDLAMALPHFKQWQLDFNSKKQAEKNVLRQQCPSCQAKTVTLREKKTWFQKIRFAGVEVFGCETCLAIWYV